MKINAKTRLSDIQEAFNNQFPYLLLQFFENANSQAKLDAVKSLGDVTSVTLPDELHFDGDMNVSDVEDLLSKEFGLYAQVFRRSGNLWLQTTKTDNWTLEEANRKGGHSEKLYHEQHGD